MLKLNTIDIVYLISFLDLFAIGLIFPLFSNHLRELGASHFTIGLLNSTYAGIQVISGPIIGGWSDVRGRKSVLQTILACCCIFYGLLGFNSSIFLIFLQRFVLGFIKHTQTITKAVITDLVPYNEQSGAFGKSAAYSSFGFIIGPLIGGHLSEYKHGFTYVCCITSILFIISFFISTYLPNDVSKNRDSNQSILKKAQEDFRKTFQELKSIEWERQWYCFLIRFLYALAASSYFSNQAMHLKETFSLSQKHVGYTISYFSIIGVCSAFFLKSVKNFYKEDESNFNQLFHFFVLSTICFILISISSNIVIFLICLIPVSFSSTTLRVVSMELMLKNAKKDQKGSISGASNSVMSVARFVSPLFGGIMGDLFGEKYVTLIAVIPCFIAMLICYRLKRQFKQNKTK